MTGSALAIRGRNGGAARPAAFVTTLREPAAEPAIQRLKSKVVILHDSSVSDATVSALMKTSDTAEARTTYNGNQKDVVKAIDQILSKKDEFADCKLFIIASNLPNVQSEILRLAEQFPETKIILVRTRNDISDLSNIMPVIHFDSSPLEVIGIAREIGVS